MRLTHDGRGAARRKCFAAAKPCDYCNSAAALLFCRLDFAFMCISCDAKLHCAADDALKHERVWICDVCEQAPAAVTCKADAAALCATCDRDIHSANPLSRRHERAAVVPFYDTAESMVMKSTDAMFAVPKNDAVLDRKVDAYIPYPWDTPEIKSIELLFSDSDHFFDFDNYQICSTPYSDSVVPAAVNPPVSAQLTHQHSPENRLEIDFTRSNITSYNNSYTPPSISHSISSSSLDAGVVPDGSAASETSHPFSKITSLSVDLTANQGSQVIGMDREARVLRYREKRKNRKFEKTIRYASRKAYAETRPRIKGRFAKRTDSEPDINGIFSLVSGDPLADTRYGVVPTF